MVNVGLECPSRSETTLIGTPVSQQEAGVGVAQVVEADR